MPTRLLRWMRSKLCAITAFTPSRRVPFAAQSRELPVPVFLAGNHDQRHALRLILHRRVVDAHALAVGLMNRDAAFDARHHQVLDAHVGERAAHHHFMIAAPRAVAVEVRDVDALLLQINAGG